MDESGVAQFALFGEAPAEADPDFLHVEDVRSRSRLHAWRITPHVHRGMAQVIHVAEGGAEVRLDGEARHAAAPCLVCIPGGAVHAFAFEPETRGWVVTAAEEVVLAGTGGDRPFEPLLRGPLLLPLAAGGETARLLAAVLPQMQAEFAWPQAGRALMLEGMLRIVLTAVLRHWQAGMQAAPQLERRRALFLRFRRLVEAEYRSHWPVARYAAEMALSQAQLNRLCKAVAGKPAGELVLDRLALEARRHLTYSAAGAAQIAYDLGFEDPAYFSRFFKRRTGLSPMRFRAAQQAAATAGRHDRPLAPERKIADLMPEPKLPEETP